MAQRTVPLTAAGKARLEQELEQLRTERLPGISARIQEETESGDVSDNSEYEELKETFAIVEARIQELEQTLANAVVLGPIAADGVVSLGSTVTIRDEDGTEESWVLVSPAEATAAGGAISTESPVGRALLGRRVGESTTVETPVGPLVYTIAKVG